MGGKEDGKFTYVLNTRRKILIGLFIVTGIAFSWVGSTQFAQSTYDSSFNAPFFTMWFSTIWMILAYIPCVLLIMRPSMSQLQYRESERILGEDGLCPKTLLKYVLPFCTLWGVTNYCYLRALGKIAAADVTALFSSCNAFVYVFSMIFLYEPLLFLRGLSVAMSMSGVCLMAYADGFAGPTVEGTLLSIAAAVGAALYKVLFKRSFGDASSHQVAFFLSCLGVVNLLCFWPIMEIFYYSGEELIVWSKIPWAYLCGTAVLGLVFNFLINFGVAFTFPLFISLGTLLGIPINAVVDSIWRHQAFGPLKAGAAVLIIAGFLIMLLPPDTMSRLLGQKKNEEENPNLLTDSNIEDSNVAI